MTDKKNEKFLYAQRICPHIDYFITTNLLKSGSDRRFFLIVTLIVFIKFGIMKGIWALILITVVCAIIYDAKKQKGMKNDRDNE